MMAKRHWRPRLSVVLSGALLATLALSLAGLVALRYLGPEIGFRRAALLLGGVILLATLCLGWLLARLLLRPIRALEAYAVAALDGDPALPSHFGTEELRRTAEQVIAMADALRDREASVRSYADHVTHELKTPVAAIRAAVELLQDGGGLGPEDARLLEQIDGSRQQIERQLAAMRRAAAARETRYIGETRLADIAFPVAGIELEVDGADVVVPLAREGLAVVLGNLLQNAADHGARRVTVTVRDGGRSVIVADDGHGISEGNRSRIFDPFFTTRREEGGTGMGLTIARNLLRAHGAGIELLPAAAGTAFRITFPG